MLVFIVGADKRPLLIYFLILFFILKGKFRFTIESVLRIENISYATGDIFLKRSHPLCLQFSSHKIIRKIQYWCGRSRRISSKRCLPLFVIISFQCQDLSFLLRLFSGIDKTMIFHKNMLKFHLIKVSFLLLLLFLSIHFLVKLYVQHASRNYLKILTWLRLLFG